MVWYEKQYERSNDTVKKIYAWEPWFFIVFGLFHLHKLDTMQYIEYRRKEDPASGRGL